MEEAGELHPIKIGPKQIRKFDPREVATRARLVPEKIRSRIGQVDPAGELYARAYEMLNEGASARELVISLRQTQLAIDAIVKDWNGSGSGQLLIPQAIRVHLETIVGQFQSARGLVVQVSALDDRNITLGNRVSELESDAAAMSERSTGGIPSSSSDPGADLKQLSHDRSDESAR